MMLIAAENAKRNALAKNDNTAEITPLMGLCQAIQEASVRGLMQIRIDALSDEDFQWLDTNGYEVWTRLEYRKKFYLISWENADI